MNDVHAVLPLLRHELLLLLLLRLDGGIREESALAARRRSHVDEVVAGRRRLLHDALLLLGDQSLLLLLRWRADAWLGRDGRDDELLTAAGQLDELSRLAAGVANLRQHVLLRRLTRM